ncbi:MAG: hypothetical protein V3S71_02695 [Acidobacteriota bacterium]
MRKRQRGGYIYKKPDSEELAPKIVDVNAGLARWIGEQRWIMAHNVRKEKRIIHGQEVEVTVLPLADVTGEFPYRPNVKPIVKPLSQLRAAEDE